MSDSPPSHQAVVEARAVDREAGRGSLPAGGRRRSGSTLIARPSQTATSWTLSVPCATQVSRPQLRSCRNRVPCRSARAARGPGPRSPRRAGASNGSHPAGWSPEFRPTQEQRGRTRRLAQGRRLLPVTCCSIIVRGTGLPEHPLRYVVVHLSVAPEALCAMDSQFQDGLRALKASFCGRSETPLLAREIASRAASSAISILDVGTGDGQSIIKVAGLLSECGIHSSVTGLDQCIPSGASTIADTFTYQPLQGDFHAFESPQLYDVVNATQCLYYFSSPRDALRKMLDLTKPGGLTTVTLWADNCALLEIAQFLGRWSGARLFTADHVVTLAHSLGLCDVVQVAFSGPVSIAQWLESDALPHILTVVARASAPLRLSSEQIGTISTFLRSLGPCATRRNEVLVLRR
jgi:SAM-dependent methyltransferase